MSKVLIMEYQSGIRNFMLVNLQRSGFEVAEVATGEQAVDRIRRDATIRVAVLSAHAPGINGQEICRRIKDSGRPYAVILTAERDQKVDPTAGADEVLIKPFSPAELTEMVGRHMRKITRQIPREGDLLISGGFVMNVRNHSLDKQGVRIRLTQDEYRVMKLFLSHPGKILTKQMILDQVWGGDHAAGTRIVDINIQRLRNKIEDDAAHPRHITTVLDDGYRWDISAK